MANYITGFQTSEGVKQYDYNALGNRPSSVTDATNTVISPNADYAEVGEWADGNPTAEDRLGYFVAIVEVGDNTIKIRKATSTDDVRGVAVYNPAFSGNASRDKYGEDGELLAQYNYIGVMGIVKVIDNGLCSVNGRCMPGNDGTAVPSTNNMGYAVLERVDDTHVLIAVEPGADMIQRVKTDIEDIDAAPPIVLSAEGEGVTITGSAKHRLQGLKICGKTTQKGTPAPDAPIPLENVGDDGVMAKVEGANLIPFPDSKSATQNGITATFKDSKITLSGTSTANVWLTAFTMSLNAGEYTLSSDSIPANVTVYIFSSAEYFSIRSGALVKTKTFPQGNYNFVIEVTAANVTLNSTFQVMLNKGTTAIPYQPYSQQQIITTIPNGICGIPVTSGGNYTDTNGQQWIADEIDLERGVLIKRTHTQVFKGTEPFSALGSTGDANAFFYLVDSSIKPYVVENEGFSLSSHFEAKRIISSTTDVGHQIRKVSTGEQYRVLFRPQNASGMTAAQFQTWLKSNPTTVTYALATSTEIPLSAEDIEAFKSVHTNYPTTVITSDNDAYMSVKYVVDTKTYIDNKLSELVASIKEGG
jgi:hypothetical protein